MAIASRAVCGRLVEMAQTSMPRISMPCVTRSVPISPDPITPTRTGRPSSARLARSRASPVRATLVIKRLELALGRNSRKRRRRCQRKTRARYLGGYRSREHRLGPDRGRGPLPVSAPRACRGRRCRAIRTSAADPDAPAQRSPPTVSTEPKASHQFPSFATTPRNGSAGIGPLAGQQSARREGCVPADQRIDWVRK